MGSLDFIKNLSPKLPSFKKPRQEPTQGQIAAAERSLVSLNKALNESPYGTVILMRKQEDAVEFHATGERGQDYAKNHRLHKSLARSRKTKKEIHRIARLLELHGSSQVRAAATDLLRDCGKSLALPQSTFTLQAATKKLQHALTEAKAEKPIHAHLEQNEQSFGGSKFEDGQPRIIDVTDEYPSSETSEDSSFSIPLRKNFDDTSVMTLVDLNVPRKQPTGPSPLVRHHENVARTLAIRCVEEHEYSKASFYLADALSLLATTHPDQLPCVIDGAVSTPAHHNKGKVTINHHGNFARLIEKIALVHVDHDSDAAVRQAGAELLALAQKAHATKTPIPNDESLRKPLEVIALKVQNESRNEAFTEYYAKVRDQRATVK